MRFDTAVFTNLTRDHLDYHGTLEAYGAAKARLFHTPGLRCAVINVRDRVRPRARRATRPGAREDRLHHLERRVGGARHGLDPRAGAARDGGRSHAATSRPAGVPALLRSRLVGEFNAENLLAVLGVLLGWNVPLQQALGGARRCASRRRDAWRPSAAARSRWCWSTTRTRPTRSRKVLDAARAHARGRLFCVFGCGGDRDPGKRPLMGAHRRGRRRRRDRHRRQSAHRGLRARSSRRSSPACATPTLRTWSPTAPRRSATRSPRPRPATSVLIAGKGHEDYQIVGTETRAVQRPRDRAGLRSPGARHDARDLAALAGVTGGVAARRQRGLRAASSPTRARSSRARCSSRCAASASTATTSSPRRRSAAPRARSSAGRSPRALPQVVVPDTLAALARFARAWRRVFAGVVVGITGSNGKTTVKEMIGAILGAAAARASSRRATSTTTSACRSRCAGSRPRTAAPSSRWARTTAARSRTSRRSPSRTSASSSTRARRTSRASAASRASRAARARCSRRSAPSGTAVINADDRFAAFWHGLARARRSHRHLRHARARRRHGAATCAAASAATASSTDVRTRRRPPGSDRIELALAGEHNVMNALAAAAAAMAAGAEPRRRRSAACSDAAGRRAGSRSSRRCAARG